MIPGKRRHPQLHHDPQHRLLDTYRASRAVPGYGFSGHSPAPGVPADPAELGTARIDGASSLRFFISTVIPLSRPILGTVGIYGFLSTYNQYFWPLLVTNQTFMRTTQVGIAQLRFEETLRFGLVMAGVIMVAVPTLALPVLGQRQLVRGLTEGAVKG